MRLSLALLIFLRVFCVLCSAKGCLEECLSKKRIADRQACEIVCRRLVRDEALRDRRALDRSTGRNVCDGGGLLFLPDCRTWVGKAGEGEFEDVQEVNLTFPYDSTADSLWGKFSWKKPHTGRKAGMLIHVLMKRESEPDGFCLVIRNMSKTSCTIHQQDGVSWVFGQTYYLCVTSLGSRNNTCYQQLVATMPDCALSLSYCLLAPPKKPVNLKHYENERNAKNFTITISWTPADPSRRDLISRLEISSCSGCKSLQHYETPEGANNFTLILDLPGPYYVTVKQIDLRQGTDRRGIGYMEVETIPRRSGSFTVRPTAGEMTVTSSVVPDGGSVFKVIVIACGLMGSVAVIIVIIICAWSWYSKRHKYRLRNASSNESDLDIPPGDFLAHTDQTELKRMMSCYVEKDDGFSMKFESKVLVVYSTESDPSHAKRCRKIVHKLNKVNISATSHEFEEHRARMNITSWAQFAVSEAEYIIIVCSESLMKDFNSGDRGIGNEQIIRSLCHYIQALYTNSKKEASDKCIPVILDADQRKFVPDLLHIRQAVCLEKKRDLEKVIQIVTGHEKPSRMCQIV